MFVKRVSLFVLISILLVLISTYEVKARNFTGRVCRVRDGDSVQVEAAGRFYEIRLYGIDAPEFTQRGAKLSTIWLDNFLHGESVVVHVITKDRYNRFVAIISSKGKVVNEELVRRGFAWVYPLYCRKTICRDWKKAETQARKNRQGIWRQRHPVPPWRWRHRSK